MAKSCSGGHAIVRAVGGVNKSITRKTASNTTLHKGDTQPLAPKPQAGARSNGGIAEIDRGRCAARLGVGAIRLFKDTILIGARPNVGVPILAGETKNPLGGLALPPQRVLVIKIVVFSGVGREL